LIPIAVFRNLVNNEFYRFDPTAGTDAKRHTLENFSYHQSQFQE